MHYLCRFAFCFFASVKIPLFSQYSSHCSFTYIRNVRNIKAENGYQKNYEIIMGFRSLLALYFEECTKKLLCRSHDAHFVGLHTNAMSPFIMRQCEQLNVRDHAFQLPSGRLKNIHFNNFYCFKKTIFFLNF